MEGLGLASSPMLFTSAWFNHRANTDQFLRLVVPFIDRERMIDKIYETFVVLLYQCFIGLFYVMMLSSEKQTEEFVNTCVLRGVGRGIEASKK